MSFSATDRQFRLETLVDFVDDALLGSTRPITATQIDSMMCVLKAGGVSRVSWAYYADERGGFACPTELPKWRNFAATYELLGNPLRVAVEAGHRHGIDVYATSSPTKPARRSCFRRARRKLANTAGFRTPGGSLAWRAALPAIPEDGALCIVTTHGSIPGPAVEFEALAKSILGDRLFVLDAPQFYEPSFWTWAAGREKKFLDQLKAACLGQNSGWNKEELDTSMQALACVAKFQTLMEQCGMELHPQPIAEAWGASFDGCVLKYSLNFRRLLGLGEPIEIVFDKTVPDAAFLLDIESCETHHLPAGLRLFLFRAKSGQSIGLFTGTAYSVGDILQFVDLYLSMPVTVVSKQEIRYGPTHSPTTIFMLPTWGITNCRSSWWRNGMGVCGCR